MFPEFRTNQDVQHFFGVKDCIINGICSDQSTQRNDLVNVSSVAVCTVCSGNQVTGLTGVTNFDAADSSLLGAINSKDGWFTTLPISGERSLSGSKLLGGSVFFTTFAPTDDICAATGQGYLYALYYLTGTAYTAAAIGTTPSGSDVVINRSIALDAGLPSELAIQMGSPGTGATGAGSVGGVTGFVQSSSGVLSQIAVRPALWHWSRIIVWRDL